MHRKFGAPRAHNSRRQVDVADFAGRLSRRASIRGVAVAARNCPDGVDPAAKELVKAGIFRRQKIGTVRRRWNITSPRKGFDIYSIAVMVLQWEQRRYKRQRMRRSFCTTRAAASRHDPQLPAAMCGHPLAPGTCNPRRGRGPARKPLQTNGCRRTLVENRRASCGPPLPRARGNDTWRPMELGGRRGGISGAQAF